MLNMNDRCLMVNNFLKCGGRPDIAMDFDHSFLWMSAKPKKLKIWFKRKYGTQISPENLNTIFMLLDGKALFSGIENTWLLKSGVISGHGLILLDIEDWVLYEDYYA